MRTMIAPGVWRDDGPASAPYARSYGELAVANPETPRAGPAKDRCPEPGCERLHPRYGNNKNGHGCQLHPWHAERTDA